MPAAWTSALRATSSNPSGSATSRRCSSLLLPRSRPCWNIPASSMCDASANILSSIWKIPRLENRETWGTRKFRKCRNGTQWIVHLGMTGQLLIGPPEAEMLKHTHAVLKLEVRTRAALRRHAALRQALCRAYRRRSRESGFGAPGARAAGHRPGTFHPALPRPQDSHQERAAESEAAERSRQHLRRRVAVSRQGSAEASRHVAYAGRAGRNFTRACRRSCARPSSSADRRSATTSTPKAAKDSSN